MKLLFGTVLIFAIFSRPDVELATATTKKPAKPAQSMPTYFVPKATPPAIAQQFAMNSGQ